jgi:magnesium chelatase family protein
VLLLDEACEFPRSLLEALRQPLEERTVTVTRARGSVTFPAAFTLVAASNPCPCGHRGDGTRPCTCDPRCVAAYQGRLSGPMRDRLDLCVSVPRQPFGVLFAEAAATGSTSAAVRHRIDAARRRQRERAADMWTEAPAPAWFPAAADSDLNAALDGSALAVACRPVPAAVRLLATAGERLGLSARAFHRVLRVSRTIADLAGDERVGEVAVAEALRYRAETTG